MGVPDRLLRSGGDDGGHGRDRPRVGAAVPGFAGKPDGLRHRHLLQLREEDPRRRGRLGLPPHLRGRAGLRGRRRAVLNYRESVGKTVEFLRQPPSP